MESQNILCFMCEKFIPPSQLQTHLKQEKLNWTVNNKTQFNCPEEYYLLLKTNKAKLSLNSEEIIQFNNLISTKKKKQKEEKKKLNALQKSINKPKINPNLPRRMPGERPRMLICALCGKEYGSLSLPIHQRKCKEDFNLMQSILPKNERRNADEVIKNFQQKTTISGKGQYDIDNLNEEAFKSYNELALVPCKNCGRTFLPDRLVVHLRSCRKKIK